MREGWAVGTGRADVKQKVRKEHCGLKLPGNSSGCQSRDALGTCKAARTLTLPNHIPLYF